MDEFWKSLFTCGIFIRSFRKITQYLRQYFTDEQLIETVIPYKMFYYDKNPIWVSTVTQLQAGHGYNRDSHIEGLVDLSNVEREDAWKLINELPICDNIYMKRDLGTVEHFADEGIDNTHTYDINIKCTDTDTELIAKYDTHTKIVVDLTDLSDITDADFLAKHCSKQSDDVKILLPAKLRITLPVYFIKAKTLEINKKTTIFYFAHDFKADEVLIDNYIVHTEEMYDTMSHFIKDRNLNGKVTLI